MLGYISVKKKKKKKEKSYCSITFDARSGLDNKYDARSGLDNKYDARRPFVAKASGNYMSETHVRSIHPHVLPHTGLMRYE